MCVRLKVSMCVCVSRVLFSKAPHSPNMFLSVHFTKTEEVVHDLTQLAPCRFVALEYRPSTSAKTLLSFIPFHLDLSYN